MQIPREYSQFEEKNALLIAAGFHCAKFFMAQDGILEELDEFEIENPTYTDREGAVQDNSKKEIRDKFIGAFESEISDLAKQYNPDEIYVFAPEYFLGEVMAVVEKWFRSEIRPFTGNFFNQAPQALLEKILQEQEELEEGRQYTDISEEAADLLKKRKK